MKKILVTGGTVFVSRYIAEYYVAKHYDFFKECSIDHIFSALQHGTPLSLRDLLWMLV